jgi:hypothetical protein
MMIDVLLDIDGPLADHDQHTLIQLYSEYFKLDISLERRQALHSVSDFEALPETHTFKDAMGAVKYDFLMQIIAFDPRHIEASIVQPSSCEGVTLLARSMHVSYCTARRGMTTAWTERVEQATRSWLGRHAFPNPDAVTFCEGPAGKLHYIAESIIQYPRTIVLIDDLASKLIQAFSSLTAQEQEALAAFFTLAAYGSAQSSEQAPFKMIPFLSWEHIDCFFQYTKGFEVCPTTKTKRKKMTELKSI